MNIMQRQQAIETGCKFYFTGKACKRGHIAERRTTNGVCVLCDLEEQRANQSERRRRFNDQHGSDYHRNKSKIHYDSNKQTYVDRAKQWNRTHADIVRDMNKQWRERNPEYMVEYLKRWWANNRDKARQYRLRQYTKDAQTNWRYNNRGVVNFYTRCRQAAIRRATPKWANMDEIRTIYQQCHSVTLSTGESHHVDHIVPILGKNVCGLHVPQNLQILPKRTNLRKSNKHESDYSTDPFSNSF